MKSLLLLLIFTFAVFNVFSQNTWINHNQSYFKIKISEDGFYVINKTIITRDAPQILQIDPNTIRLYNLGEEVPVDIEIINNEINSISFYAEKNKGSFDKTLYRSTDHHFNPEYSLICDTSSYYITWNNSLNDNQYDEYISDFNNLPSPESYFVHESKIVYSNNWNRGKYLTFGSYNLSKGVYEFGEGFGGDFINDNVINVNTPYASSHGPLPKIHIRGYASGYSNHNKEITINNHVESLQSFYGDSVMDLIFSISHNNILQNTQIRVKGKSGSNDKTALSVVSIKYPRIFNFNNQSIFKFTIESSSNKKYLEINNFDGGLINNQNVFLYDITNQEKIQCYWDGSLVRAVLPYSTSSRDLVLVNSLEKKQIHQIYSTNFVNYNIARGDYVIITHPNLFLNSKGDNPIFDYAAYRTTTGDKPVIVNVEDLYDQFSYGIYGHPLAIKTFISFIKDKWQTIKPKNVFLIGKARVYNQIRNTQVFDNLVPTFGSPPSDNLLASSNGSDVPSLPIGRLSATTGDDVTVYLNKVKTLENNAVDNLDFDNQLWRKRVIHLGGGSNIWEQTVLKNHLVNIEDIINKDNFGANVYSFFKDNDTHTDIPNSVMIDSLINNGVSMISFFGHGSVKGYDFYLNSPEHYTNTGKYPLLIALGCYNGTMFNSSKLMSERFIFRPDAGAIGYIGFVDAVTIGAASNISKIFYEKVNSHYGSGIGELLQKTLEEFTATSNYSLNSVFQMGSQYLTFHGDPAIKLNYRLTPDFVIDSNSIKTSPETITEKDKEFYLTFDVHNLGKYNNEIIQLQIERLSPNGIIDTINLDLDMSLNESSIEILYDIKGYEDFGLNKFNITIDYKNDVNEMPILAEQNNTTNYSVMIGNPKITPLFPKNFGMISDSTVTLKAMSVNGFDNEFDWFIELDTTKEFNSTEILTYTTNGSNILTWTPNITLTDERVYYWRVRVLDLNQNLSDWITSSFIYKSNMIGEGWNQSHLYQFKESTLENISINENSSDIFEYTPSIYEISATTGYIGYGIDNENLALYQNGNKVDKSRCSNYNGIYVAVLDPTTLNFWTLPGGSTKYGAINCDGANRTAYSFLFDNSTLTGQQNFESFVMDSIPNGHRVIIYTLNNGFGSRWSSNLISHLKSNGAIDIDSFTNATVERSYAFAYKNGDTQYKYTNESVGLTKFDKISVYTVADKPWNEGSMKSPVFGPAKNWNLLKWSSRSIDLNSFDQTSINIIGIDNAGISKVLISNILIDSLDISSIDANQYPYLQLVMNNKDDINLTPSQLEYWRVYGESLGDIALIANNNYEIKYDVANNERYVELDLSVWNFGLTREDSTNLYVGFDNENKTQSNLRSINPNDSINIKVNIPLLGLIDERILSIKVESDKKERTLYNNWSWVSVDLAIKNIITDILYKATNETILQSAPNPFIEYTKIKFPYTKSSILNIYNIQGILVRSEPIAKIDNWDWDGRDINGNKLIPGVYLCDLGDNESLKIVIGSN